MPLFLKMSLLTGYGGWNSGQNYLESNVNSGRNIKSGKSVPESHVRVFKGHCNGGYFQSGDDSPLDCKLGDHREDARTICEWNHCCCNGDSFARIYRDNLWDVRQATGYHCAGKQDLNKVKTSISQLWIFSSLICLGPASSAQSRLLPKN